MKQAFVALITFLLLMTTTVLGQDDSNEGNYVTKSAKRTMLTF